MFTNSWCMFSKISIFFFCISTYMASTSSSHSPSETLNWFSFNNSYISFFLLFIIFLSSCISFFFTSSETLLYNAGCCTSSAVSLTIISIFCFVYTSRYRKRNMLLNVVSNKSLSNTCSLKYRFCSSNILLHDTSWRISTHCPTLIPNRVDPPHRTTPSVVIPLNSATHITFHAPSSSPVMSFTKSVPSSGSINAI